MRTLYIDARTYNNDTSVSVLDRAFADCVLDAISNIKPEGAAPDAVIKAWLDCEGRYEYPPADACECIQFEAEVRKGESPFCTDIAYLRCWENDDVLDSFNITLVELPEGTPSAKEICRR